MQITNSGQNLIFLISQPRAGSTMTQRILGSHPLVHTTSEPWVMLHPLYAMKTTGIDTEYSSDLALSALHDFLSRIENGTAVYYEKIREMYASLYSMVIARTEKKYYLDKTPRYYFIIRELKEVFPDAKFIILLRNPLAVLASMVNTWTKEWWFRLSEYKYDLLRGPDFLIEGLDALGERALKLIYEDIVADPEQQINRICRYIGIDFDTHMISYGKSDLPKWLYGDPQTVYEKTLPDASHAEKWIESLVNPQFWRVARDYLDYLGESRLTRMGYSFHELDKILNESKPPVNIDKCSVGLNILLDNIRDAQLEKKELKSQASWKDTQIARKQDQIIQKDRLIKQRDDLLLKKDEQIQRYINLIKSQDEIFDRMLKRLGGSKRTKPNILGKFIETGSSPSSGMDTIQKRYHDLFDSTVKQFQNHFEDQVNKKDEQLQAREQDIRSIMGELDRIEKGYPYKLGKSILFPITIIKEIYRKFSRVF